jgi:uncharacterized integral membrane protein
MTGPSYLRPEDDRPGGLPPAEADPEGGAGSYGPPYPEEPVPERPLSERPLSERPATERPATERPATERPSTEEAPEKVPTRTRTSSLWVAVGAAVVVLLLLLIFILQNGSRVQINIFGANPGLPLGVALLLAAALGALLVVLIGTARVMQLRHTARRIAKKSR